MAVLPLISLAMSLMFQAAPNPVFPENLFTEKEKRKLEKNQDDLEERIEVYRDASTRICKNIEKDVSAGNYGEIPARLKIWVVLLTESLKDIEANIDPKKRKLKDLIKYEIQIREAIHNIEDFKLRAPPGQQEVFESRIGEADTVRGKMVKILFQ
jgi:hypothetical protein